MRRMQRNADMAVDTVSLSDVARLGKALWFVGGALLTIAGAIFGAGIYYATLTRGLSDYKTKVDAAIKNIQLLQEANIALRKELNEQFAQFKTLKNGREFVASNGPTGAGASPGGDGRCPQNEVLVGLQRMEGNREEHLLCAKMPEIKIDSEASASR
jgi:hypothetical protein